jgi:hypothetical protein
VERIFVKPGRELTELPVQKEGVNDLPYSGGAALLLINTLHHELIKSKKNLSGKGLCGRCLSEFTDWRYSQSCWYFDPAL